MYVYIYILFTILSKYELKYEPIIKSTKNNNAYNNASR